MSSYCRVHQVETSEGYDYIALRLVSNYKSQGSGDSFKRLLHGSAVTSSLWTRCLDFFIIAIGGSMFSVGVQTFPYFLIPYPTIANQQFPLIVTIAYFTAAGFYALLTLFVIIPIFHCDNKDFENSILKRNQKISQYSEKECIFRLTWYIEKLLGYIVYLFTHNICDLHVWWRIISTFTVIILSIPFALINKLSLQLYVFRRADIFAYILCNRFQCGGYKLSHSKAILKAIIYILCGAYSVMSILGIWLFLQLLVRVFITSTSFVMSHSNFFSSYLAIGFPFLYFVKQAVGSYSQEKMLLSQIIFDVRDDVEAEIDNFLSCDEGQLIIRFITTDKGIRVDLPVKLHDLQDFITLKLESLSFDYHAEFRYEEQIIEVNYKLLKVDEEGNKDYDITFSRFNDQLSDLGDKINQQFKQQGKEELKLKLVQVYYDIKDEVDNEGDVGVPMTIYNYIAYTAPKVATSTWQLMGRLFNITLIGMCFLLAVASFYNIDQINSLTNAVSGTILSYVTMVVSMNYAASGGIEDHKKRHLVKTHMVNYSLGYRFFFTRGSTFNPCTQMYESIHWHKLSKKSMEIKSDLS